MNVQAGVGRRLTIAPLLFANCAGPFTSPRNYLLTVYVEVWKMTLLPILGW
jgi:hypothetical protein